MRKTLKRLTFLISLILIWGTSLFYFDNNNKFSDSETLGFEKQTQEINEEENLVSEKQENEIIISYNPLVFLGPDMDRQKCGAFYCYTGEEFVELYNNFESKTKSEIQPGFIYSNKEVDNYLQDIAEALGYKKRVFADEGVLVHFENVITRPEVRDAYKRMRNEMQENNMLLHFVSGYRDSSLQRSIFQKKVAIDGIENIPAGLYDAEIYETLSRSALPGYSKHHSGYAVDFGCGNDYLVYTFAETDCYEWMSANNFENAKRFGFIPSYPEGVENQGPNPEPWEFVWIGKENLI